MKTATVFLTTCWVIGCLLGCTQPAPSEPEPPDDSPELVDLQDATVAGSGLAVFDLQTANIDDPEYLDKAARADVVILTATHFWRNGASQDLVDRFKLRNPDVKVIGYVNAHTSWYQWGSASPDEGYVYDWYHATKPYWAHTTTGDTMTTWPGKPMLRVNLSECRAAMVQVLRSCQQRSGNKLDGVFWDCFNDPLWIAENADYDGELDLDEDGIGHYDDEDEMAAYRLSQEELVQEVRAAFGGDFIQIFNGNRAPKDSVFAALGDGMLYEHFPDVPFGSGGMHKAFDLTRFNNVFTAVHWPRSNNGGPYVIYNNEWISHIRMPDGSYLDYPTAEWCRAMALLTGALAAYHDQQSHCYGWPQVELDLGAPLGPPLYYAGRWQRDYERGQITVDPEPETRGLPMEFIIEQDGQAVQSFQYPTVYPNVYD